ncbi:uncharacterized protein BX664DRAFT_325895 [Halteromyces radiatus]|uniref:uncharacterized protein n=1 Tax=Halteromyces radiatus TaxID=101107 RepID=UPI00221FC399|nr:uncharacterized protein BX664DRAFT_325895 [Halteromyces radiatus]KAI8097244.1 hypothetical protein BX664DRAFT_325895 [Halteromyces radiatus]
MTVLLRILKSKGNIFTVVFLCTAVYFLAALLPTSNHTALSSQQQQQQQVKSINKFSRIKDDQKRQLLYSALGHIRIGYVANRTPDVDIPPLLVMSSCKSALMPCGSWGQRLLDMTSAYFFSMLVDGTAFTMDMTDPLPFQSYFESYPGYMSLQPSQAYYYIRQWEDKGEQDKVRNITMQMMTLDANTDYKQHFQHVKILQTTQWPPLNDNIATFGTSSAMKRLRDRYQLNRLETSEWFWLVYRLLLNPTDWLATQLEPHRTLMGGSTRWGESLSMTDPRNQVATEVATHWFRIGLRLDDNKEHNVDCWLSYIEGLCDSSGKDQCHVFVSATSISLLDQVRRYSWKFPSVTIHTISDAYDFTSIDNEASMIPDKKKKLFESEDQRLKMKFARSVMDWTILTRLDYLLGSEEDTFIKTAAWAAQVQTDLLAESASCQIKSMTEW